MKPTQYLPLALGFALLFSPTVHSADFEEDCTEDVDCTENLKCLGTEGKTCGCADPLQYNTLAKQCQVGHEGQCEPEPSIPDVTCNAEKFLDCVTDKCECSDNQVYDTQRESCALKLEETCIPTPTPSDPGCVFNADCNEDTNTCACLGTHDPNNDKTKCLLRLDHGGDCSDEGNSVCDASKNLRCLGGFCECNEGLIPNNAEPKVCQASHGTTCKTDGTETPAETCNIGAHLECDADNKCACKIPADHFFDNSNNMCIVLVTKTCNKAAGSPTCAPGSTCEGEGTTTTCNCKAGLLPTRDNQTCQASHGMACNNGGNPEETCNAERFFKCGTDAKCECNAPDDQVFESEHGKCSVILGKNCDMSNPLPVEIPSCVSNAKCQMEGSGDDMKHFCACNSGYSPDKDMEEKTCKSGANGIISGSILFAILAVLRIYL